jgi:hypothetical protein
LFILLVLFTSSFSIYFPPLQNSPHVISSNTDSLKQNHSREANSRSAGQECLSFILNRTFITAFIIV